MFKGLRVEHYSDPTALLLSRKLGFGGWPVPIRGYYPSLFVWIEHVQQRFTNTSARNGRQGSFNNSFILLDFFLVFGLDIFDHLPLENSVDQPFLFAGDLHVSPEFGHF